MKQEKHKKKLGIREERRIGIARAKKNLRKFFERIKKLKPSSCILDDEAFIEV